MASSLASDASPGTMQVTQHRDRDVATSHPVPHPEIFSLRKHPQVSLYQQFPKGSHTVLGERSFSGLSTLPLPGAARPVRGIGRVPWATEQTPPQGGTVLLTLGTLRAHSRLTLLSLSRKHGRP